MIFSFSSYEDGCLQRHVACRSKHCADETHLPLEVKGLQTLSCLEGIQFWSVSVRHREEYIRFQSTGASGPVRRPNICEEST